MKQLLSLIVLFLISIQISYAQEYLLDSTASLFIFGGFPGNINSFKYKYDDQNRIKCIKGQYQIREYQYSNQFDHTINIVDAATSIIDSRINNFYNLEGQLIVNEVEFFDFQDQVFFTNVKNQYEYNQNGQITKDERFNYHQNGEEYMVKLFTYEYENGRLLDKVEKWYNANNTIVSNQSTQYHYDGENLIFEENLFVGQNGNSNSYTKTYAYDSENRLESSLQITLSGLDSLDQRFESYTYTENGVFQELVYTVIGNDFVQTKTTYTSTNGSQFYAKDTIMRFLHIEDELSLEFSELNNEVYSASEDSALVRFERRFFELDFGDDIREIDKKFYILKPNFTRIKPIQQEVVAHVFPNPSSKKSTLIIQKESEEINRVEIFNVMGQRVQSNGLSSATQTLIQSPEKTGQYFVLFFRDGRRIGQIQKLTIQ